MGPPSTGRVGKDGRRNQNQKKSKNQKDKKDGNTKKKPQQPRANERGSPKKGSDSDELSRSIPIPLQQLLLNIFRSALLFSDADGDREHNQGDEGKKPEPEPLAITPLIQTLKTHLYNRDFLSAFADADEDLLRAYALRWSAGRALGYVGVLDGVWRNWVSSGNGKGGVKKKRWHAVCIGGGAGAEIVALAGVWRMLRDEIALAADAAIKDDISKLSIDDGTPEGRKGEGTSSLPASEAEILFITAVDIADWSPVVNRLSSSIKSPSVPSTKSCRAPLLPPNGGQGEHEDTFNVSSKHLDVLSLSDEELQSLLCASTDTTLQAQRVTESGVSTDLVTLMFTLNELFSTSIPKTTSFLLRMTDLLEPGTVLLVVDSPGSYSTVALGKKGEGGGKSSSSPSTPNTDGEGNSGASTAPAQQQKPRTYPMRMLLDHTLLSVAAGCWECVLSDESRWFRREAAKLSYDVGEGIGLEDMRFQVHVYRRLKG